MPSQYSPNLKIELIGTGEQSGTWGTTTNTNLGTAIEEAITGTADVNFANADVTLTLTSTNTAQTARNLRLNLIGSVSAARNLIVPSVEKQYIINNTLSFDITVKNATGTGVTVPAGKSMIVFNTNTNVVEVSTALATGTVLPVANGGTGQSTALVAGGVLYGASTTAAAVTAAGTAGRPLVSNGASAPSFAVLGVTGGGTGVTTSTGTGNVVLSNSPTLVTPVLGTPTSGTLTSCTGLPISTGVAGLGTGMATFLATPSSANLAATLTDETGTGANVFATSPTLVTPLLGTPTSGTLTNCTGLPVSTGVSGLGTGVATFLGTPSSANLAAAVTDETGTGSLVFGTNPTIAGATVSGTLTSSGTLAVTGGLTLDGAAGTAGQAMVSAGTGNTPTWSTLGTMSSQNANAVSITGGSITGITDLAVADGGTGSSTLAANNVLLGNDTSALQTVAPGTSGNVLTSNGTTWTSAAIYPAMYMLAADGNATATRNVFLTAGTWQVVLQDSGGGVDPGNYDYTVTRNGTVSTTTVTTSYRGLRSGGAGYGRAVYGIDNAVGSLVVSSGATVTMSIAAPVVTGSGAPATFGGAILWANKIS